MMHSDFLCIWICLNNIKSFSFCILKSVAKDFFFSMQNEIKNASKR